MSVDENYTPFSQRNGFAPIPPQLEIGEVSQQQRLLLNYAVDCEIERSRDKLAPAFVDNRFRALAKDVHVKFLKKRPATFRKDAREVSSVFEQALSSLNIGDLYDMVEFIIRHPDCKQPLIEDIADAFKESRAAYRLVGKQIVAIGTEEQAAAVERAFSETEAIGALASKKHLLSAGVELRHGNWSDSVRESIHAVEAMATRISPDEKTLGAALTTLERSGYIHGSLKDGFKKLYGYTNDEGGIRHALSEEEARVDEVDALFMLGACASFVSYLIARENSLPMA